MFVIIFLYKNKVTKNIKPKKLPPLYSNNRFGDSNDAQKMMFVFHTLRSLKPYVFCAPNTLRKCHEVSTNKILKFVFN